MICVIVGRGRHSSMIAEWKEAAEAGVELVELRLDCLRRDIDLKRLLAERPTPVVITIRRGKDGGLWRGDEDKRLRLLREAIVMGVDYVDLEDDVAGQIRRFGTTKRIVSHHDFKAMPGEAELKALAGSIGKGDPDVVKIAAMARDFGEVSRMLQFVRGASKPTIGLPMGAVGSFARVLGAKFGAPWTYAAFNPDRVFAPGLPLSTELKRDYFYDEIDAETELYAVIGDPIGHSLSPAVHNAAFRSLGLNKLLVPIAIPRDGLKEAFAELGWLGLKGFSVTIPHKEAIVGMLAKSDRAVEQTGSCNTVVVQDGKWTGYNTDYRAAMHALESALGGLLPGDLSPLHDKQVLILGAGGVARTIAFGLVRRGAGVTICSRDDERSARLAEAVGCRSTSWSMRAATLHDVLINCTPVGMHPEVNQTPVPAAAFKPDTLAFDTVYHPENTLFLKLAREHDCKTISGVDMFVMQAALQFGYYTGKEPPVDLMRKVVKRKLSAAQAQD